MMLIRAAVVVAAVATAFLSTSHYEETMEILARMEKLAHAGVTTVLAGAVLYSVIIMVLRKKW